MRINGVLDEKGLTSGRRMVRGFAYVAYLAFFASFASFGMAAPAPTQADTKQPLSFSNTRATTVLKWISNAYGYLVVNPQNFDKPITIKAEGSLTLKEAYPLLLAAFLEHGYYVRLDGEKELIEVQPVVSYLKDKEKLPWLNDPKPEDIEETDELVLAQVRLIEGNPQSMVGLVRSNMPFPSWIVLTPDPMANRVDILATKRWVKSLVKTIRSLEKGLSGVIQNRAFQYYQVQYMKAKHLYQILLDVLNLKKVDEPTASFPELPGGFRTPMTEKPGGSMLPSPRGGGMPGGGMPGMPGGDGPGGGTPMMPGGGGRSGNAVDAKITNPLASAIGKAQGGIEIQLYLDERKNFIMAVAPKETLTLIRRLMDQIDVEPPTGSQIKGLPYLKTHTLQYADVGDTVASLMNFFGGIYGGKGEMANLQPDQGRTPAPPPTPASPNTPAGPAGQGPATAVEEVPKGIIMANLFPYISVVGNNGNNTISILAESEDQQIAEQYLQRVDKDLGQVFIDVLLAEVRLGNDAEFGVTARLVNQLSGAQVGSPTYMEGNILGGLQKAADATVFTTSPATAFLFRGDKADALIRLLQKETRLSVLSSPKLVARNNRKASIYFGDVLSTIKKKITYVTAPDGKGQVPIEDFETKEYEVGLRFTIIPRINVEREEVALNLALDITEVTGKPISDAVVAPQSKRNAMLNALIRKGETLLIGGVMKNRKEITLVKTPILSALPLIGGLFSTTVEGDAKSELVLLVTPAIIGNAADVKPFMDQMRRNHPDIDWPSPKE